MPPLRLQRLLSVLPPLLLIGSLASADAITGRVVDANGVGVAGVDLDFVSLGGGGNPHEANDGTDANGNFVTTLDPGIYEVRFFPPAPPTTNLLTGIVTPVAIFGTVNMGTITLTLGASVQATVKNAANQPVGNVKVDVFNVATGVKYHMKGNVTNAFGDYNVAVPVNTQLRTELLTSGVIGQVLVPKELVGSVPFSVNLGTITIQTGHHVTGIVRTESGLGIGGADVDITILPSGATLFTPSDNTNTLGVFDVVVPPGTYDLDVERPSTLVLVGADINDLVVTGPTDVGILTMRFGVFLSGTVFDVLGRPVLAADVNVIEVATGDSIALGSDNTNAAGFYSVVVPTGLMDVVFSPPNGAMGSRRYRRSVTTNTTLNGRVGFLSVLRRAPTPTLGGHDPAPPGVLPFGQGTPGTSGVPHVLGKLAADGLNLQILGGRPVAGAELWLGLEVQPSTAAPLSPTVRPLARIPLTLDVSGSAGFTVPLTAELRGRAFYAQIVIRDPEAHEGIAASHVLAVALGD